MARSPALLLLLALAAAPSRAQVPTAAPSLACRMLGTLGCYYAPEAARAESARQAFTRYDLRRLADDSGLAVLVTASSDLPVSRVDARAIESLTGVSFTGFLLASHSGGCASLSQTLGAFPKLERLILLDTFYFGETLARELGEAMKNGAACSGYFTTYKSGRRHESNEDRFTRDVAPYLPRPCAVENHDAYGHDDGVNACLASYAAGRGCPPKP